MYLNPEKSNIHHFYKEFIPNFSFNTLNHAEMIAEKMAAAIGRNKPRDHFDLYKILKKGHDIDLSLVKKKCEQSGDEFNIIKMFNQAKKLKNRWDEDMTALISEPVTFQEVITTLAKHFKLKEAKEKLKNKKRL
jgi:predicted nucleotidyltransferase component of viral defense system